MKQPAPDDPVVTQERTTDPVEEMEWREYTFFHEELRHEDNLINQRVSWLIGSQAFLLGGFATLINSGGTANASGLSRIKGAMLTGLPIAGLAAVFAGYVTILAAVMHVHGVRQMLAHRQLKEMPSLHSWDSTQLWMGLSGPLATPLVFVAFWIIILTKVV